MLAIVTATLMSVFPETGFARPPPEEDSLIALTLVLLYFILAMFIWQWLAVMEDMHSESEQL